MLSSTQVALNHSNGPSNHCKKECRKAKDIYDDECSVYLVVSSSYYCRPALNDEGRHPHETFGVTCLILYRQHGRT